MAFDKKKKTEGQRKVYSYIRDKKQGTFAEIFSLDKSKMLSLVRKI